MFVVKHATIVNVYQKPVHINKIYSGNICIVSPKLHITRTFMWNEMKYFFQKKNLATPYVRHQIENVGLVSPQSGDSLHPYEPVHVINLSKNMQLILDVLPFSNYLIAAEFGVGEVYGRPENGGIRIFETVGRLCLVIIMSRTCAFIFIH